MEEEAGLIAIQEKLQQSSAGIEIQIEGAIDELELPYPSFQKPFQLCEKRFQRDLPHRNIQRGQAKLATEWTAARGLNVNNAVRDVFVIVNIVGQDELVELRQLGWNDFCARRIAREQLTENLRELQIRFAGDDIISKL